MKDIDYITNYWRYADAQEDNLLNYIDDKQVDLSDELQGILDHFKSIQLSGNISKSEVERLHRKVGQWQKAGYDVGEFKLIMRDLDNRTRIKGNEALLAFLLAAFIGNHKAIMEQDKTILLNITQETYHRELDNARKITGKGTAKTPTEGDMNAILNGSIVTGGNFYDDMYADARYRADQLRKIINADLQQKKPLDIDNVQYQRALKAQKDWMLRRSQHGANKDNHAGQLDIYMSFAISETVVRAFRDAGVKKYQFIATIDGVTTDACRSLHLKIFDLDKIMIGINAPPIYPPFHYCRSIIRAVEPDRAKAANDFEPESVKFNENASFKVEIPNYTKKVNDSITKANKEVAKRGSLDNKEHLILINIQTGEWSYQENSTDSGSVGGKDFYKYIAQHPNEQFSFVHNHPSGEMLSFGDTMSYFSNKSLDSFIAAGHNGKIYAAYGGKKQLPTGSPAMEVFNHDNELLKELRISLKQGTIDSIDFQRSAERARVKYMLETFSNYMEVDT